MCGAPGILEFQTVRLACRFLAAVAAHGFLLTCQFSDRLLHDGLHAGVLCLALCFDDSQATHGFSRIPRNPTPRHNHFSDNVRGTEGPWQHRARFPGPAVVYYFAVFLNFIGRTLWRGAEKPVPAISCSPAALLPCRTAEPYSYESTRFPSFYVSTARQRY